MAALMVKAAAAQRCNHGEIYGATTAILGQNLPPPLGEIGLRYLKI